MKFNKNIFKFYIQIFKKIKTLITFKNILDNDMSYIMLIYYK